MGRSLPREESMPVVSVLQMRFDYLSFTQLSAWHRAAYSNQEKKSQPNLCIYNHFLTHSLPTKRGLSDNLSKERIS